MNNVARWLMHAGLWMALVLCVFPHVCAQAAVYRDPQGEFSIDLPQDFQVAVSGCPESQRGCVSYVAFRSELGRVLIIDVERTESEAQPPAPALGSSALSVCQTATVERGVR